jgi:gliding motility-associated lipoprotein GldH
MRIKLKRNRILYSMIAVALVLTSCNRHTIYSHYEPVNIDGWERSDTLWFCVGGDADSIFNEQMGLRINGNYPFKDLSLIVEQRLLNGPIVKADTLNLMLADEDGIFLGKGVSLFHYDMDLGTIVLPTADTLQIAVFHNMKREVLPGIASIGITLQKEP